MSASSIVSVLDSAQLRRIQAMHRGFLYLADVGLTPDDLQSKDRARFAKELPAGADRGELVHMANCAAVAGRTAARKPALASKSAFYCWWAWRFYATAGAVTSTLRAGYHLVEALVASEEPHQALEFIIREQIPRLREEGASVMMVPVRLQFALMSAACGDVESAEHEIDALRPYASGLSEDESGAFERDVQRIRAVCAAARSLLGARTPK